MMMSLIVVYRNVLDNSLDYAFGYRAANEAQLSKLRAYLERVAATYNQTVESIIELV